MFIRGKSGLEAGARSKGRLTQCRVQIQVEKDGGESGSKISDVCVHKRKSS